MNAYGSQAPLSGPAPARPYAVYLASRGRYRLLGFDFDASHGPVGEDLAELRALLRRAGLHEHVVCVSGPGGGRHVWVALAQAVPAAEVAALARALGQRLASLDLAPLTNPTTGCLRPPGAPHRHGRSSEVLDGRLDWLLSPTAGRHQLQALLALVDAAPARRPTCAERRAIVTDTAGHPRLPGERRELPATVKAALTQPLPRDADASRVLARVLVGAAWARWELGDLLPHVGTAPGLEYLRTERRDTSLPVRLVRSPEQTRSLLERQWRKAVSCAATRDDRIGDDPTFESRCATIIDAVTALQTRAHAAPGRWARQGGPSDRRVLDALCEQTLAAVRPDVGLNIRRLGELCGISRETARRALYRLSGDGWIRLAAPAEGTTEARWALPELPACASTGQVDKGVSQAAPPRQGIPALRRAWLHRLSARRFTVAQDVFTPTPGLGHHTARVYAALSPDQPRSRAELVDLLGYSPERLDLYLERLHRARMAAPAGTAWERTDRSLNTVARDLSVAGTLSHRRRRHQLEREAWAWWCAEMEWMCLSRDEKRRRRDPAIGQAVLELAGLTPRQRLGPHPRRSDGRADFRHARAALVRSAAIPGVAA